MPQYSYSCKQCKLDVDVTMSMSQHTSTIPCSCTGTMVQYIKTAPSVVVPHHMQAVPKRD